MLYKYDKRWRNFCGVFPFMLSFFITWLAPWAGTMNQILRCDWLPERARWSYLARSGLPAVTRKKIFRESLIINPLLTKLVRSRWLDIGLILFFASLWTSTPSQSINSRKKNLANIQPPWPHAWSITHTYFEGILDKTIIPLALVGYELIIANLAPCASLLIYHLISKY